MKEIEGNIVDVINRKIIRGRLLYDQTIHEIIDDPRVKQNHYIIPGLVDAHVHIESTMLTPLEYSRIALKHGVVAAVTDPHEIANVCGIGGVRYMIEQGKQTPMKIFFGAPSCVPATDFECSGARLQADDIETLFANNECSHLAEMMNFPGVINDDPQVSEKLAIARKYGKLIDGHAPQLNGKDLRKYIGSGIVTDHECTSLHEALEKISLGMKIMLRNSSASKDFPRLMSLIKTHPDEVMLCTDDCHPDELQLGYINLMVKTALDKGYDLFDVLTAASKTAKQLYQLPLGMLQPGDPADFVVIDSFDQFNILSTHLEGEEVYQFQKGCSFERTQPGSINRFYQNSIVPEDLLVERTGKYLSIIQVVEDSLLTKHLTLPINQSKALIESDPDNDILKIVVLNRYQKAKPTVGFIKGFQLKRGAIAGSIAHDSHNIVAVGVSDDDILRAIHAVQQNEGALVVTDQNDTLVLPLPVAGLMSDQSCETVAAQYQLLSEKAKALGSILHAPFMTLAFMSLLVIPELKIGDRGLFNVNAFRFVELQHES